MTNPFVTRRPLAAALVSFVLGPFVGMLYLNRGRLACLYFAADLALVALGLAVLPNLLTQGWASSTIWLLESPVTLFGTIHAFRIARRWQPTPSLHWYARWYGIVVVVLVFPGLVLVVRTFLFQPFDVRSSAMSPALNIGDYFLASKFAYLQQRPQRGDIIVFRTVGPNSATYVKRIVGLPGEHIQLKNGILLINNKPVRLQRVADFIEADPPGPGLRIGQFLESLPGGRSERILDRGTSPLDDTGVFVVPADSYFVLGDNRDNSDDSRGTEGYVGPNQVMGKPVVKFVTDGHWTWQAIP